MSRLPLLLASASLAALAQGARAQDAAPDAAAALPPKPTTFADGIDLGAQLEAGITGYPAANSGSDRAFGQF